MFTTRFDIKNGTQIKRQSNRITIIAEIQLININKIKYTTKMVSNDIRKAKNTSMAAALLQTMPVYDCNCCVCILFISEIDFCQEFSLALCKHSQSSHTHTNTCALTQQQQQQQQQQRQQQQSQQQQQQRQQYKGIRHTAPIFNVEDRPNVEDTIFGVVCL